MCAASHPFSTPYVRGEPGAKIFVDDLILAQGFVSSRAATSLRSIESHPSSQTFVGGPASLSGGEAGRARRSLAPKLSSVGRAEGAVAHAVTSYNRFLPLFPTFGYLFPGLAPRRRAGGSNALPAHTRACAPLGQKGRTLVELGDCRLGELRPATPHPSRRSAAHGVQQ